MLADDEAASSSTSASAPSMSEGEDYYDEPNKKTIFIIRNKIDSMTSPSHTPPVQQQQQQQQQQQWSYPTFDLSCTTNEGVAAFEVALGAAALELLQPTTDNDSATDAGIKENAVITRDRHRNHVKRCIYHLDEFLSGALPMDLAAEELRLAMLELGKITGRVDVDELLDVIFRDFCIGK